MICKWCGNGLSASDTKCKRCGKEIPALSDCGGFYDLVPKARRQDDTPPAPVGDPPVARPPVPRPPAPVDDPRPPVRKDATAKKKRNSRLLLLKVAAFAAAGFVFLFVMLLVLQGKVNRLSDEVERLKDDLDDVYDVIETLPTRAEPENEIPGTTESTPATTPGESTGNKVPGTTGNAPVPTLGEDAQTPAPGTTETTPATTSGNGLADEQPGEA